MDSSQSLLLAALLICTATAAPAALPQALVPHSGQPPANASLDLQLPGPVPVRPLGAATQRRRLQALAEENWLPYRVDTGDRSHCNLKFSPAGFNVKESLFEPTGGPDSSSITCYSNPVSRGSICNARNLRVDSTKVTMSRGGEDVPSVFNRREQDEFPAFHRGVFALSGARDTGKRPATFEGALRTAMDYVEIVPELRCTSRIKTPTLFTTRYDYANMYHETTNFFNGFLTMGLAGLLEEREDRTMAPRVTRTRNVQVRVVFVDGHAQGSLDSAWSEIFKARVVHFSTVPPNICFENVWFVPPQGSSALDITRQESTCTNVPAVREFANFVTYAYDRLYVQQQQQQQQQDQQQQAPARPEVADSLIVWPSKVLTKRSLHLLMQEPAPPPRQLAFIFRENYLCHPRNPSGTVSRHIRNRDALEQKMQQLTAVGIPSQAFDGARMNVGDQVEIMLHTRLFVGVHGAGLTLVLYMQPGTTLLELKPPTHSHAGHFSYMARLVGVNYVESRDLQRAGHENYDFDPSSLQAYVDQYMR